MSDFKHNVCWQVSLSNGETLFEEKGDYKWLPDVVSPWSRLMDYIVINGLEITSLALYTRDGKTYNLPSLGKNPKFQEFNKAQKPIDYQVSRKVSREMKFVDNVVQNTETVSLYTVASAFFNGYELQLWVDENNTKNCWVVTL